MTTAPRRHTHSKASTSTAVEENPSSQMFTIGKIDAGIAVLISDSVHLIEFPSLLLPLGVGPGSIVNISCSRNVAAERATSTAFWDLQQAIFSEYGSKEPEPPRLRVRNVTQTSVTLEWDKLDLAQAKLLGLSIWRNGQRLMMIPNPSTNTSTKLSGLALDTDYTFHLSLKTSAGTFTSPVVKIRTHTIADTSGVSVCFGLCEPADLLSEAQAALAVMKGRYSDKIQIDTTHFVATSPAAINNPHGGPGVEYQKALQLSIPVVSPEWVIACARESKMVPIANYYSIGTTNHAASLSSAQLVLPNGTLPSSKQQLPRRATAVTIEEEPAPSSSSAGDPVPAVAPAPARPPRSELAEEEPDAPPEELPVGERRAAPAPSTPRIVVEADEEALVEEEEEEEAEGEPEGVETPKASGSPRLPEVEEPKEEEPEHPDADADGLDALVKASTSPVEVDAPKEDPTQENEDEANKGNESMESVGL